jgi:hypothetical protein
MLHAQDTRLSSLRTRFPDWTEEQYAIAEDKIIRYVALALEIYEEALANPDRGKQLEALTGVRDERTIEANKP